MKARIFRALALLGAVTGLLALSIANSAHAAEDTIVEEIVVTAAKRAENIQDVGASVTAFSGDSMRKLGMDNPTDFAAQTPNMTFSTPLGEGSNPTLAIRGVALNTFVDNDEQPVAMYVDEVYLGTIAGQTLQLFDIERVEVLRGPQGTLYGRNTTGGLVHFISKKPSQEFDAYVDATFGKNNQIGVEGAVGGGLSDAVSGRLSWYSNRDDGFQVDRTTGDRGGSADAQALRAQLLFELGDNAELLWISHAGDVDQSSVFYNNLGMLDENGNPCSISEIRSAVCFDDDNFDGIPGYRDPDGGNPYEGDYTGALPLVIKTHGSSVKLELDFNDNYSLTSVTGFEHVDKMQVEGTYPGPVDHNYRYEIEADQLSQELRVAYTASSLKSILGIYAYTDDKDGGIGSLGDFYQTRYTQKTDAYAVFAQADYDLTADFTVISGLRYTRERKQFDMDVFWEFDADRAKGDIPAFSQVHDERYSNVSGKLGIEWRPNYDSMIFGNISRGYRSGGFNGAFVFFPEQVAEPINEEILTSYEIGIKTSLTESRADLNVTAFYYDYEDLQTLKQTVIAGDIASLLSNAAQASVRGAELELFAKVTDNFDVVLGASYLDSETKDFIVDDFDADGNPVKVDFSGTELVFAPEFTANGVFRYSRDTRIGLWSVQADFNYTSDYYQHPDNHPLGRTDSYTLWNSRIAWANQDDTLEVAAWIKNLTDRSYAVNSYPLYGSWVEVIARPRTYGVSISYRM